MECPVDGKPLYSIGPDLYRCPDGHMYRAEYQVELGPEVECTLGPFKLGRMPQLLCTIAQIGIVGFGVGIGIWVLKSIFGRKEERRKIIIYE